MKNVIKRLLCVCALSVLPLKTSAAQILWDFEGTLSAESRDTLNIDGETITLNLVFDTNDVWLQGATLGRQEYLYFPTSSSSVTITGGHTIETKSPRPAARFSVGLQIGGIVEAVNNPSYIDFIINGVETLTFSPNGPRVLEPSVGDNLRVEHLRSDPEAIGSLFDRLNSDPNDLSNRIFYSYSNPTVSVALVPVPSSSLLLITGLLALLVGARSRSVAD